MAVDYTPWVASVTEFKASQMNAPLEELKDSANQADEDLQDAIDLKITGPASADVNTIGIFSATTGTVMAASLVTIDASGSINIPTGETYDINGSTHTHDYAPTTHAHAEINTDLTGLTPTDLTITTGAAKTLVLATPVYDDLRIVPGAFEFAGNSDPSLQSWQPGGSGATYKVWAFDDGNEVFFTCQLPHGYKIGADISCHVHWTPGARGTTENTATVGWKLDYSWANINAVFAASATIDMTDACQNTNDEHLMTPDIAITGTDKNISSHLVCRLYRDGGTWAGTGANAPALLEVDFHVPIDTIGSRTRSSK